MNRGQGRSLALTAVLGVVAACASHRAHLLSVAEAERIRIYVRPDPLLASSDDDCRTHYPVLSKSLPYAVRHGLRQSGFTVVRHPTDPHDAEAVIDANLTYCRKSGTCVNGAAEVTVLANGSVLERHRYDTGDAFCSASPTVDEFPELFVENVRDSFLDSQPVAIFARSPRTQVAIGAAPPHYAASAPTTPAPGPAAPASLSAQFSLGAPQPNAFALIVGIQNYRDVPAPPGARADAVAFARIAERTLGIPEAHIRLLLDEHATRGDLEKALAWLELNAPAGGRIYFFYSGHGAPDPVNGTAYVLPYDGDPAALEQTAIPLSGILDRLAKTKASDSMAFLDACFSGAGGRSVLPKGTRPLVRVQTVDAARGVSLLASSGASEISGATPDGESGLFTKYLVEALGQVQGDLDGDQQITLGELKHYVEPRVARDARLENRLQTPTLTLPDGVKPESAIVAFGVKR